MNTNSMKSVDTENVIKTRQDILEAAISCVTKERNDRYGDPEDSFKIIAELWNAYLQYDESLKLSERDVAAMMILLKIARIRNGSNHLDSWIDIAGYAACGGELEEKSAAEEIPDGI